MLFLSLSYTPWLGSLAAVIVTLTFMANSNLMAGKVPFISRRRRSRPRKVEKWIQLRGSAGSYRDIRLLLPTFPRQNLSHQFSKEPESGSCFRETDLDLFFRAFYRDKSARLSGASATLLCQGQFIQLDTHAAAFDRAPSKTGTKAFQEKKRKKVTGV